MIVAIDGPAASGKSTVAKAVARRLGVHYLDTGAMYRAVALKALRTDTPLADDEAMSALARSAEIAFAHRGDDPLPASVILDGEDVTDAIRTPEVDAAVSSAARVPGVREAMVAQQRRIASHEDLVVEGRDTGTVVFPHAEVKVFLSASAEERARRRHLEHGAAGHVVAAEEVLAGLEARDVADSTRETSPLAAAPDAERIDTTDLTIGEVVERVVRKAEEARGA